MRTVRSPDVEKIPLGIVLHPLFSTEPRSPESVPTDDIGASESVDHDKMYIHPPAETSLKVTGASERLTGLISMELTARGFRLRDLPVQAPVEGESVFAVSLSLLDELRERQNVKAILIGNAFFDPRYGLSDAHVTDLYLKLVDVETLAVMYQMVLPHQVDGWSMDDVARTVADHLATEANLPARSN
jgi:hypothetical protein